MLCTPRLEADDLAAAELRVLLQNYNRGTVVIMQRRGARMKCHYVAVHKAQEEIRKFDMNRDLYVSQFVYRGRSRATRNLLQAGLLFVDIDTYNVACMRGKSPEEMAVMAKDACLAAGIPEPSYTDFSGGGLHLKWLFERAIPKAALPRWHLCQQTLVEKLKHLGADPKAKDASRVLRVVGSRNTKQGEVCRIVDMSTDGAGVTRYNFEKLWKSLVPKSRRQVQEEREEWKKKRREQRKRNKARRNRKGPKSTKSDRSLAMDRWMDLRDLRAMREAGPRGYRKHYLLWELNFALLAGAIDASQIQQKAKEIGQQIDPGWTGWKEGFAELTRRAENEEAQRRGEKLTANAPLLYRITNASLIDLFDITEGEQHHLATIISKPIALARKRVRETEKRRLTGAMPRKDYLARAAKRRRIARLLRETGLSYRAIAWRVGVSKSSAHRYCNEPDPTLPQVDEPQVLAECPRSQPTDGWRSLRVADKALSRLFWGCRGLDEAPPPPVEGPVVASNPSVTSTEEFPPGEVVSCSEVGGQVGGGGVFTWPVQRTRRRSPPRPDTHARRATHARAPPLAV